MSDSERIRCGDAVLHKPTGERWLVAYADYDSGTLAWTGWPEGRAEITDCERTRSATDKQHKKHVSDWLDSPRRSVHDHRVGVIQRLYRPGVVAT